MFSHKCIKCKTGYMDSDPDPYFCFPCREKAKSIAQDVNKKLAAKVHKQTKSGIEQYNDLCKKFNTPFPPLKSFM